ncbi:phosphonate C-P lyase system protein PhnH [Bordetella pseudohinzii]|uniref:Carbon-phosphorus lyase complex subunit n=1 Tax=Bordetella pseudohinzii TaxID=1331258 RepID=A0A0J6BS95_9BORD|nr:phosphonate C-P lyase system protein PhnH [Bordetella pseudohinzii]ANY16929.1 phosphonate C-P lyase system protein PhnH [Bordetella pseudohinzii]KMM24679.1 carbon-phosphorus lyase [Bordetella pseudohinzii]KXA76428.1 carbon-phosphorus lyase subunit PhnH [Bordetella pseudohinzii]KXA77516.1 carbon-phosphorus lyase subunit PhnH [Bordetella pseudohinzii]CUJ07835.1 carbon-phosphorus lyase complex subunit [Bordetella pseudohinzii]
MNATADTLLPLAGFAAPVDEAQASFRQALDALAQPGRVTAMPGSQALPPGMGRAMTALLLTLADADTPVWLPPGLHPAVAAYLRFHCGCPLTEEAALATFVAVPAGHAAPALSQLAQGDPAYPDRSATLILEVDGLAQDAGARLAGPGIAGRRQLAVQGLPEGFWAEWGRNHQRFPLGVDVFFTRAEQMSGLPRSTAVEA